MMSKKYNLFYDYHFHTRLCVYYGSDTYYELKEMGLLKEGYKYMNTLEYKFLDPKIEKISDRLNLAGKLASYQKQEMNYISFTRNYISIMNVLDRAASEEYQLNIEPYIAKMCDLKFEMFGDILFSEDSIQKIMEEYNQKIMAIYASIFGVIQKAIKNKKYLTYMRR